jgi:hypothetical protein
VRVSRLFVAVPTEQFAWMRERYENTRHLFKVPLASEPTHTIVIFLMRKRESISYLKSHTKDSYSFFVTDRMPTETDTINIEGFIAHFLSSFGQSGNYGMDKETSLYKSNSLLCFKVFLPRRIGMAKTNSFFQGRIEMCRTQHYDGAVLRRGNRARQRSRTRR